MSASCSRHWRGAARRSSASVAYVVHGVAGRGALGDLQRREAVAGRLGQQGVAAAGAQQAQRRGGVAGEAGPVQVRVAGEIDVGDGVEEGDEGGVARVCG